MEETKVDCRGLSCPEPVLRTTRAIKGEAKAIRVQLDSEVAVENVSRLGRSKGFRVSREETPEGTQLLLTRD